MNKTITSILMLCITSGLLFAGVSPNQIEIPAETLKEIKYRAASEWPEDFTMQRYEIEKQVEAYKYLYAWARSNSDSELAEKIFRNAQSEWPDDFTMQWYEVEKQVEAIEAIYGDG